MSKKILHFIRKSDNLKFISSEEMSNYWILESALQDRLNGSFTNRWSTALLLRQAPAIIPVYEEDILKDTLRELPVGYIPSHTKENLPELVKYHVERSGFLGALQDEVEELLERGTFDEFIQFAKKIQDYDKK